MAFLDSILTTDADVCDSIHTI